MTFFLPLACRLTGSDYRQLMKTTTSSRTKVMAQALAMLIPTVLWMASSFLLAYQVLNVAWYKAVLVALTLGFVVITIERLIVMGNGNWVVSLFRVLLAIVVAFIGANLFDLVLFKSDIDQQMPNLRHEAALNAQNRALKQWYQRNNIDEKKQEIETLWNNYQNLQQEATKEAGGLSDNGLKGAGSATRFKQNNANKAKADYQANKQALDALQAEGARYAEAAYQEAANNFNDKSLLYRIKAMDQMIRQNPEMKKMYWLITLLLFFIEFLVLIFKLTWPKTAYEWEVEALDRLHRERTERMMGYANHWHQPHKADPVLKEVSTKLLEPFFTIL